MKKALIVYYSQAGQTERAVEHLARGLGRAVATDLRRIEPEEPFKFPWSMRSFFRAFPRCMQSVAPRTQPLNLRWDDYDLVLLASATRGWNGAEIEQAVVSARIACNADRRPVEERDLLTSMGQIVPLSTTMSEQIKAIRSWARTRALPATTPGRPEM